MSAMSLKSQLLTLDYVNTVTFPPCNLKESISSQEFGFADCRKDPVKQWEYQLKTLASVNILQKSIAMLPEDADEEILVNHRSRLRDFCVFQKEINDPNSPIFNAKEF